MEYNEKTRERFSRICEEVEKAELEDESIGTLSEKRLHRVLKNFISDDKNCHEMRIKPDGLAAVAEDGEARRADSGKGGYIADIFTNGRIYEIQTGSFFALKSKIDFYLSATDYVVTVVYPVAAVKWGIWIDPLTGDVSKKRKSPKHGSEDDILAQAYYLMDHIKCDRLNFMIPLLEIEEYRRLDGWSADRKKGSGRVERIPVGLVGIKNYNATELCRELLPTALPEKFTAAEFSKLIHVRGKKLYGILKLFCAAGEIERGEKEGRSFIYRRVHKK